MLVLFACMEENVINQVKLIDICDEIKEQMGLDYIDHIIANDAGTVHRLLTDIEFDIILLGVMAPVGKLPPPYFEKPETGFRSGLRIFTKMEEGYYPLNDPERSCVILVITGNPETSTHDYFRQSSKCDLIINSKGVSSVYVALKIANFK
jgi:hypothetical protein